MFRHILIYITILYPKSFFLDILINEVKNIGQKWTNFITWISPLTVRVSDSFQSLLLSFHSLISIGFSRRLKSSSLLASIRANLSNMFAKIFLSWFFWALISWKQSATWESKTYFKLRLNSVRVCGFADFVKYSNVNSGQIVIEEKCWENRVLLLSLTEMYIGDNKITIALRVL